ncbi:MAG: lytic transglycosylase domain-containing protein [Chloroflexota bacterium]
MQKALLTLVLGDLWQEAVKLVAGLVLAVMVALAFAVASVGAVFAAFLGAFATVPGGAPAGIPPEQVPAMQSAAATCALPWQVLAAVAKVESDFGANMATSSAGAIGYGQFLPSTWAAYGDGGDPYDYRDALPAMARYLCDHGGPAHLREALYAYNHAEWYVDLVLEVAAGYGYTRAVRPGL